MCLADAPVNATYANFTSDRIFHAPTDLNFVIGRVLVLNDSDTAIANTFTQAINPSPYNPAGIPAYLSMAAKTISLDNSLLG